MLQGNPLYNYYMLIKKKKASDEINSKFVPGLRAKEHLLDCFC
jgi:hypothetical protein